MRIPVTAALAVVLLFVGLVAGAFVPQIHQAYVTQTKTVLSQTTIVEPRTVFTTATLTEHATTTKTAMETVTGPAIVLTQTVTSRITVPPPTPVEEIASRFHQEYDETWTCIGRVQNVGARSISALEVVVCIYDPEAKLLYIKSDWIWNLEPGAKASFEVIFKNCPLITTDCTYEIDFQITY